MIILHAAAVNAADIGGPHVSVPALVAAQNRLDGVAAALLPTVSGAGPLPEGDFLVFGRKNLLRGSAGLNLPVPFNRPDLVVFHSTYIPAHLQIGRRLRRMGVPYVICPRGGMTRYAQAYKWLKKRAGNLLGFNRLVAHAGALHCLTRGEAEASRDWNCPIFVVGNGVHLPRTSDLASPGDAPPLRLVFVGRLHVTIKGLDMLLDACRLVRRELRRARARVELYGPHSNGSVDCQGSRKFLAGRIAGLGLQDVVTLPGPVVGKTKTAAFQRADVFLHPSRTEGHPSAVLEALAHGVPCLLTPGTNMADEVAAAGAGWKVEPSPEGIAAGISEIISQNALTLRQAGVRARRLAGQEYSWANVATRSVKAYRRYAA